MLMIEIIFYLDILNPYLLFSYLGIHPPKKLV